MLVAVGLADDGGVEAGWPPVRGVLLEDLGEGADGVGESAGARVVGEELGEVGAQGGGAAGLEADDRQTGVEGGGEDVEGAAHGCAGAGELAGGDPGQAAADGLRWDEDAQAGVLEDGDGGAADGGGEVVGERVRPQDDARGARGSGGCRPSPPPTGERLPGQGRDRPLGRDAGQPFRRLRQRPYARQTVERGRCSYDRRRAKPQRQPPHRVVGRRAHPARVVVVEELRLVRGHVHPHRAVAAAALAGQAQVEGLPHLLRPPAVRDDLARQHLVQQSGTAARGVPLLARDAEGRAHHARTQRLLPALGDPDAAPHRRREVPAVGRVAEGDVDRGGRSPGQDVEAEVRVEGVGADDHSGVEAAGRVPQVLEALEERDDLRPVHARQQLGARLPVAVLARQRTAVGDHERGHLLREGAVAAHALGRQQVDVQPYVHAALAEVPVRRAPQSVAAQQGAEVPQIRAEAVRRNRAVLPAGPGLAAAGQPGGEAGRVLPHAPQGALRGRVGDDQVPGGAAGAGRAAQRVGAGGRLLRRAAADLGEEPGPAVGQPRHRPHQVGGHPLGRQRPVRQQEPCRVRRRALVPVPQHQQDAGGRLLDEPDRGLRQDPEGALAAGEGPGQVGSALGQQGVEGVARAAPGEGGEAGAQQGEVAGHQRAYAVGEPCRHPVEALPEPGPFAVVRQDVQRADVVGGGAPGHRVGAAGVVADHPAQRAPPVRGRVRPERQPVRARRRPQVVEDDPRLDDGGPRLGVDAPDRVHVPREVEHHPFPRGLPRHRRPPAARHHRHPVLPARGERGGHVVGVPGRDDAEGDAAVVRGVHGDEGAAARVEGDVAAAEHGAEGVLEVAVSTFVALFVVGHVVHPPAYGGGTGSAGPAGRTAVDQDGRVRADAPEGGPDEQDGPPGPARADGGEDGGEGSE